MTALIHYQPIGPWPKNISNLGPQPTMERALRGTSGKSRLQHKERATWGNTLHWYKTPMRCLLKITYTGKQARVDLYLLCVCHPILSEIFYDCKKHSTRSLLFEETTMRRGKWALSK